MSSIVGSEKAQGHSIRNDNGYQFLANKVRIYLNEMGIDQEFTNIATPEENSYIGAPFIASWKESWCHATNSIPSAMQKVKWRSGCTFTTT